MPGAIIGALVGGLAKTALVNAFGTLIGGALAAGFGSVVGGIISSAIRGKPKTPTIKNDIAFTVQNTVAPRQVVYGRVRTGGTLINAHTDLGTQRIYYRIFALASHQIEAIDRVYFGDAIVQEDGVLTPSYFYWQGEPTYNMIHHLGSSNQNIYNDLASFRATGMILQPTDRLQGIAALTVLNARSESYEIASATYPNGVPNVSVVIRGKRLYDPRSTLTAYSNNPALCILDFLRSYLEVPDSAIDMDSFITAANVCDESVPIASGGVEKRYTLDGVIDLDYGDAVDVLEGMLSSMAGQLWISGGIIKIRAGVYTMPVGLDITEDMIIGQIDIQTSRGSQESYNMVTGTYLNPGSGMSDQFTTQRSESYIALDGEERAVDVQLGYTSSASMAQRIARILLLQSRQDLSISLTIPYTGYVLEPNDVITVTSSVMGWVAKEFRVAKWSWSTNGTVKLDLLEEDDTIYDWSTSLETLVDNTPPTTLVSFIQTAPDIASVTESLVQVTTSSLLSTLDVVLTAATPVYNVAYYQLQYSTDQVNWITSSDTSIRFKVSDIAPGTYYLRCRVMTVYGTFSDWSPTYTSTVIGVSDIPNDVANFTVTSSAIGGMASWDESTELDVRVGGRIEIRWTANQAETSAANAVIVYTGAGTLSNAIIPLQSGAYFASWVDIAGNRSATPARWSMTAADVISYTLVSSLTESTTYPGTAVNLDKVASTLRLGGLTNWDSIVDNIDSWPLNIDDISGFVQEGYYDWSTYMDGTTVKSYRLDISTQVSATNTSDTWDTRLDTVDDWSSVDGDTIGYTNAITYYATTNDDPAGSPTWSGWAPIVSGLVYGRAVKLRTYLSTADTSVIIAVTQLSATLRST